MGTIGAVGEIIGAAGVIVTLIYLAFQIRLNTKAIPGSASFHENLSKRLKTTKAQPK